MNLASYFSLQISIHLFILDVIKNELLTSIHSCESLKARQTFYCTMSNNTTANINQSSTLAIGVAYYALSLIIVGTILNLLTFVVLCRKKFSNMNERPTLYYMRVAVIFDIFMLYGWNFDHYSIEIYGFNMETYNIASCKVSWFYNYFIYQTSAWLRVFICLDRYLSLSRLHRTWFGRPKSVLIIIACIVGFSILFNLHILIFGCFYEVDGSLNVNASFYTIYPWWDYINLSMYNCLPFLIMVTLNSGVIYHLFRLHHTTTVQNSRIQHRAISIAAVVTSFLFLIMSIPGVVAYAFFVDTGNAVVLNTLASMIYTYHILAFPIYIITFNEFRQEFIKMALRNNNGRRITPHGIVSTHQLHGT